MHCSVHSLRGSRIGDSLVAHIKRATDLGSGGRSTFYPRALGAFDISSWNAPQRPADLTISPATHDAELHALAKASLRARRIRRRHLPDPMFGEPAWDMLLSLYAGSQSEARPTISRLVGESGAPATTALRWIDYLESASFVERRANPTDRRVAFVHLTDKGHQAIEAYLEDLMAEAMVPDRGWAKAWR